MWWVYNPKENAGDREDAKKISKMKRDDREKLITFDIRYSDVEEAIKTYQSTVDNKKYLYLLKYSLQLIS